MLADPLIVPRGLSRSQAAAYIGVGATLFDRLVMAGTMPRPREIGGRRVWDRQEVDRAFEELPHVGDAASARNPWDAILEDSPADSAMSYSADDGGASPERLHARLSGQTLEVQLPSHPQFGQERRSGSDSPRRQASADYEGCGRSLRGARRWSSPTGLEIRKGRHAASPSRTLPLVLIYAQWAA